MIALCASQSHGCMHRARSEGVFGLDSQPAAIVASQDWDVAATIRHELVHWLSACSGYRELGEHEDALLWGPDGVEQQLNRAAAPPLN